MSAAADLYNVLGIERGASHDEVKRAYRALAKKHHPDVNPGDTTAEERFKEISAAGEILTDPQKRRLYDEFGEDATRAGFDADKARQARAYHQRATAAEDLFGGVGFGDFDLGDLFGGGFGTRTRGPRAGANLHGEISIELGESVLGGERSVLTPHGTLHVKIPPGIDHGQTIRLAGKGAEGMGGGPPGDLMLSVNVRPHALLRREGGNLYMDLPVTVPEAMSGARVRVPTLTGQVSVEIPAGSQNGQLLRLRGKGVPGPAPGDLYCKLQVQLPKGVNKERLREAAAPLVELYSGDVRSGLKL